jgi:periplasmic protein TonB
MVYDEADPMPEYPGGKTEMMNYVSKNLRYPAKAKKEGVKAFVQVQAIVEKDGTIKYASVHKEPGYGMAEEAIRLVKTMRWNPGYKDGGAVRVRIPITVTFMPK